MVETQDDRSIRLEEHLTSIAQFERVPVNINGGDDWRDIVAIIMAAIERQRASM